MNLFALLSDLMALINNKNPQSLVALIQEILNALSDAGFIALPAKLVVDGQFGGTTFAAVKILLAKFGFNLAEPLASIVYNVLLTWLPKLSGAVKIKG